MALTDEQMQQYRDDGYCLVPGLLSAAAIARYDARFVEFASGALPPAAEMKIMRDIMVVKGEVTPATPLHGVNKMISFEDDTVLFGYAQEPQLLACVRSLLGDALYSISTNVFNKPPGVDGRHPLHQDLRYFRIRPASAIVGVWTALSNASRDHGCLAVIPGSHRGDLCEHEEPDWEHVNYRFFGARGVDVTQRRHIEMAPGDTLFFHPLLVHGSGRNRTDAFRRSISAHYAAAHAQSSSGDWRTGTRARRVAG